ncbi:MAG: TetR/AcrR family transcriptional regulator [Flavobacteriales bacterium]|nr:TetR/AcrR family transcriptional regulator [Flavobacteriales bacterium]
MAILARIRPILFQEGFSHLSMDDLARQMGMSKSTLYMYFRTREDIWEEILRGLLAHLRDEFEILNDEALPYLERLNRVLAGVGEMLDRVSDRFWADLSYSAPDHQYLIHETQNILLDHIKIFYKEGLETGVLKEGLDLDILVTTDLLFCQALLQNGRGKMSGRSYREVLDGYFKIKTRGILAEEISENQEETLRRN